jgi:hypothetical protein
MLTLFHNKFVNKCFPRLFNFRKVVSNRDVCYDLVPKDYPIEIINAQKRPGFQIIEGRFWTPLRLYLPTLLVPEVQQVFFQMILPQKWPSQDYRPICIHLAGTGDHVIIIYYYITELYKGCSIFGDAEI